MLMHNHNEPWQETTAVALTYVKCSDFQHVHEILDVMTPLELKELGYAAGLLQELCAREVKYKRFTGQEE